MMYIESLSCMYIVLFKYRSSSGMIYNFLVISLLV